MTRDGVAVKAGWEYDKYFPRAKGGSILKKKGATIADTVLLIPLVVKETHWQAARFAKEVMLDTTLEKTCSNIWHFIFSHIAYKPDEEGKEQIRSFARTWRDRFNNDSNGNKGGVDCDCYSVFISCILTVLKIPHRFRITKYSKAHFQHIYVIVPTSDGRYITIDPVTYQYNFEEKYTEKKDFKMDLEYLNGVDNPMDFPQSNNESNHKQHNKSNQSGNAFYGSTDSSADELGKLFKKRTSEEKKEFRKKLLGKVSKLNKFNPVTIALRAGILAAMKLNFLKIPAELKYTYLEETQAQQMGVPMDKYQRMKGIREKLEKIFFGAGGKEKNLKIAILKGKGNRNKEVDMSALAGWDDSASYNTESNQTRNLEGLNATSSLSQILGKELMASESMYGLEGFSGFDAMTAEKGIGRMENTYSNAANNEMGQSIGQLGEPATGAAIAAASSVLAVIAGLIKTVGSIIPKKHQKAKDDKDGGINENPNESSGDGASEKSIEQNGDGSDKTNNETSNDSSNDSNSSNPLQAALKLGNNLKAAADNGISSVSALFRKRPPIRTAHSPKFTKPVQVPKRESNGDNEQNDNDDENEDNNSAKVNKPKQKKPTQSTQSTQSPQSDSEPKTFWQKYKKWILGGGAILGTVGAVALVIKMRGNKSTPQPWASPPKLLPPPNNASPNNVTGNNFPTNNLNGLSNKKKRKLKTSKAYAEAHQKKKILALK